MLNNNNLKSNLEENNNNLDNLDNKENKESSDIEYIDYINESNLLDIQLLVSKDLSEPYSIFTYRYFLINWPNLCVCAYINKDNNDNNNIENNNNNNNNNSNNNKKKEMIGTIVCKADIEQDIMKGYIAMLTVNKLYRNKGIGLKLAMIGIQRMIDVGCQEIILETEVSNKGAISLYEKLGFLREERLARYYLNGGDAYRLRLVCTPKESENSENKDDLDSTDVTTSMNSTTEEISTQS